MCTYIHTRRRIGYQLVVVHVVDSLCAVNTPGLRRFGVPEKLSCKAIPWKSPTVLHVKSISPIQENSMKNGYDENDDNKMSDETKCETNYSIITKWNDVNTHNYM